MINLQEIKEYQDLLNLKRKNTIKRKILELYITIFFIITILIILWMNISLALFLTIMFILFFIDLIIFFRPVDEMSAYSNYKDYYYQTFLPSVCSHFNIQKLLCIDRNKGIDLLEKSGLYKLIPGTIDSFTCFLTEENEFNYFGFYTKFEAHYRGSQTTFDGLFFIKEQMDPLLLNLKIKDFKASTFNIFNKKGYSGTILVNDKEILLNDKCIKLLKELESRFGTVYLVANSNYLAVQFSKLLTKEHYLLNPYLEKGIDSEDHLKFIEFSNLEKEFSHIIQELLSEIQSSIITA